MSAFSTRLRALRAEAMFMRVSTVSPATVPALALGKCSKCCFFTTYLFCYTFILFKFNFFF